MSEVIEGSQVRLFCLYEHVTLLTDSGWAIRIGHLGRENTGFLVRLSVSARCGQSKTELLAMDLDVSFSGETVYLSLPLVPTEDISGLVSFLVGLLTHFFFFRAQC